MMHLDHLDIDELMGTPTRLRATAAAIALVLAGERPSLTRVAALAGVSRSALHKTHRPVVDYVAALRSEWTAQEDTPLAELQAALASARAEAADERRKRKQAEVQRDRALHHLELSDATLRALSESDNNVVPLPKDSRGFSD